MSAGRPSADEAVDDTAGNASRLSVNRRPADSGEVARYRATDYDWRKWGGAETERPSANS